MTEPVTPSLSEGLSLDTSGVAPAVFDRRFIQSLVDQSLAAASEILVKSVDARLEEFKRRFSPSSSDTPHDSKKSRLNRLPSRVTSNSSTTVLKSLRRLRLRLTLLTLVGWKKPRKL